MSDDEIKLKQQSQVVFKDIERPLDKKKMGCPSAYSKKLVDYMCERISEDIKSVFWLCNNDPLFPKNNIFYRWLAEADKDYFRGKYAEALHIRAKNMQEARLSVAFDSSGDLFETKDGLKVNNTNLQRAKLKIETMTTMIKQTAPKKHLYSPSLRLNPNLSKEEQITQIYESYNDGLIDLDQMQSFITVIETAEKAKETSNLRLQLSNGIEKYFENED